MKAIRAALVLFALLHQLYPLVFLVQKPLSTDNIDRIEPKGPGLNLFLFESGSPYEPSLRTRISPQTHQVVMFYVHYKLVCKLLSGKLLYTSSRQIVRAPGLRKTLKEYEELARASTLRVSPKGCKPSPRIVYREGEQDSQIDVFLKFRKDIKNILKETY